MLCYVVIYFSVFTCVLRLWEELQLPCEEIKCIHKDYHDYSSEFISLVPTYYFIYLRIVFELCSSPFRERKLNKNGKNAALQSKLISKRVVILKFSNPYGAKEAQQSSIESGTLRLFLHFIDFICRGEYESLETFYLVL
jgi:hypothetical protein